MNKKLKDFTIDELVDRATGAFGNQNPTEHAKHEDERNALYAVLSFKCAKEQIALNGRIKKLTVWLVILTIVLVVLTGVMAWRIFFP